MNKIPRWRQQRQQRRPSQPGQRRARPDSGAADQAGRDPLGHGCCRFCRISFIAVVCLMSYIILYLFQYVIINHSILYQPIGSGLWWWVVVVGGGVGWLGWWWEAPGDHWRPQRPVPTHRFWPGVGNLPFHRIRKSTLLWGMIADSFSTFCSSKDFEIPLKIQWAPK